MAADLSGDWEFRPGLSTLQIPAPESMRFTIRHSPERFHLERTHVFQGERDEFTIDLAIGADPIRMQHRGIDIVARAYWEGDLLVFDSTMGRGGESATNVVRYSLADAGRTLVALERLRGDKMSYENRWVFERRDAA